MRKAAIAIAALAFVSGAAIARIEPVVETAAPVQIEPVSLEAHLAKVEAMADMESPSPIDPEIDFGEPTEDSSEAIAVEDLRPVAVFESVADQVRFALETLACDENDIACQRFVGDLPARKLPPRDAPRKWRRAGPIQLDLNDYELERERRCLAISAYAEARGEGDLGMVAVMWVILNRVATSKTPTTPCAVILARGAFEAMMADAYAVQRRQLKNGLVPRHALPLGDPATIPADERANIIELRAYKRALLLAYNILDGRLHVDPTNAATHYWSPTGQAALKRPAPSWVKSFVKTAEIGGHEFFRASTVPADIARRDAGEAEIALAD